MEIHWLIKSIPAIVILIMATVGALIGNWIGSFFGEPFACSIAGIILSLSYYVGTGYVQKPEREADIIEAFGRFRRVVYPGPAILCLPGLIDRARKTIPYKVRIRRNLFTDEKKAKLELKDSVVMVEGHIWYYIQDPIKWFYNYKDPEGHLEEAFDNEVRPKFQMLDSDEADIRRPEIVKDSLSALRNELFVKSGAYVDDFYIPDFDYGEVGDTARMQKYQAETRKTANITDAEGWNASIEAVMKAAEKNGNPMTWQEAREFVERQWDRKMVEKTGSNVYILGPELKKILGK